MYQFVVLVEELFQDVEVIEVDNFQFHHQHRNNHRDMNENQ